MPKNPSTVGTKTVKTASKTTNADPGGPDPSAALSATQHAVLQRLSTSPGMSPGEMAAAEKIGLSTARKALAALEAAGLARREHGVRDGAQKSPDQWFAVAPGTATIPEPVQEAPQSTAASDASSDDAATDEDESQPDPSGVAAEPADFTAEHVVTDIANQEPDTPRVPAEELADSAGPGERDADDTARAEHGADSAAGKTQAASDPADTPDTAPTPSDATGIDTADAAPNQNADTATTPQEAAPAPASGPRLGKGELRMMVERYLREHPEQAWTPGKIAKVLGRSAGAVNNASEKLVEDGTAITFDDAPRRFQIAPAPAQESTRRATKTAPKPAA